MNNKIFKKYTDPSFPGSFSGSDKFFRSLKQEDHSITKSKVEKVLNKHEPYTLHKPVRKQFKRSQVIVSGIDDTWQIDLVDMSKFSRENRGFRYILTVIDVFSKHAWAVAIKKKDKNSVTEAFNTILKESKRVPKRIHADKGKEFYNSVFKNLLNKIEARLFSTFSVLKASVIERFNRTLKQKMWRMFTHRKNHKYINDLSELLKSYNNSYHRSIKTKPILVNKDNEKEIWNTLYGYDFEDDILETPKIKLRVGDLVRVSIYKKTFEKGYTPNWSEEVFIIYNVFYKHPTVYLLKDLKSEIVEGYFYEKELQKVDKSIYPYEIFVIDKIFSTRKNNKNQIEKLVSFIGKDKKEWVSEDQLDK